MSKPNLNSKGKFINGYYIIKNVDKYIGDPTKCIYRSSWEKNFMVYCEMNDRIKKWGSETIEIPYVDGNGKTRRYFPDFYLEIVDPNDKCKLERIVIEVKPAKEVGEPAVPKKQSGKALENYEFQLKTFVKNLCKWTAAKKWCDDRYMKFIILTENHLQKRNIL